MSSIALLNKYLLPAGAVLISMVLSACQITPPRPAFTAPTAEALTSWSQRQHALSALTDWHLSGRLAVSQGEDAWNLNLDWQQRGQNYEIAINGPFGIGKVRLVGNAQGVMLRDSDNQMFYAESPEALLYDQTGVRVPVAGLRYWVMGLTAPDQVNTPQLDAQGRLVYVQNDDWQVDFKRYTRVGDIDLPRKVFLAEPGKEIDVRLVVDRWKLGAN